MSGMFLGSESFNGDVSKWDVSRVTMMNGMFSLAKSFNGYISKWNVSSVTNMNHMFMSAKSFKQHLYGSAWVHSKATKKLMFEGSSASIAFKACDTAVFTPQSSMELNNAVDALLKLSPKGVYCSDGPHGLPRDWDVSAITDMSSIFLGAISFNYGIVE